MKLKGEIVGFKSETLSDSGKQEVTIALDEDVDAVPIGSKVEIIGGK